MNSIGFYQVCPGKPVYSIGRPLFDEVTVNLSDNKQFVVKALNNSKENKYIEKAVLNGVPLEKPFISHEDIKNGGVLEFTMTSQPTKWGI